jgi:hypothetical protein
LTHPSVAKRPSARHSFAGQKQASGSTRDRARRFTRTRSPGRVRSGDHFRGRAQAGAASSERSPSASSLAAGQLTPRRSAVAPCGKAGVSTATALAAPFTRKRKAAAAASRCKAAVADVQDGERNLAGRRHRSDWPSSERNSAVRRRSITWPERRKSSGLPQHVAPGVPQARAPCQPRRRNGGRSTGAPLDPSAVAPSPADQ